MATILIFHEVKNGEQWAEAWRKGKGSRHELFAMYGMKARTFRDPKNSDSTGVIVETPDVATFQKFMDSVEAKKAMTEDGLKLDTVRTLVEFVP
jgi:hypothetical protein